MEALRVDLCKLHVAEHGLVEELLLNLRGEELLLEVGLEHFLCSLEHADVHDVVVVDVVNLYAVFVV